MKSRRLCHAAFEFGRSARVPAHRSKVNGEPNTNVVKTAENRGSESERERRWEKRFFGRDLKFRGNLAPRAKQTTLSLFLFPSSLQHDNKRDNTVQPIHEIPTYSISLSTFLPSLTSDSTLATVVARSSASVLLGASVVVASCGGPYCCCGTAGAPYCC